MKPMKLRGKYLGGLPEEPTPYPNSQGNGNAVFHVNDGGIGVRVWRQGKMHAAISWDRIASIELSGGTAAKSKVGATVMFGLAGALGSAGSQDRTEMTVNLKDGNKAYYQIFGKSELAVRAQLLPVMAQLEGEPAAEEIREDAVDSSNQEPNTDVSESITSADGPSSVEEVGLASQRRAKNAGVEPLQRVEAEPSADVSKSSSAGWRSDPWNEGSYRWWDGKKWTDARSDTNGDGE
jgi:hypothetical protein